jgi:hypothetical protein
MVNIQMATEIRIAGGGLIYTIATRKTIKKLPPYTAINGFGASRPISRSNIEEVGIAVTFEAWQDISFSLAPDKAEKLKPRLCVAVQGAIDRGIVYHGKSRHEPTMAEPDDLSFQGQYISVRASQILAINVTDGSIVAAIPIRLVQ